MRWRHCLGVIPNGKGTKTKGYPKLKNYKPSQFMLPTSCYDKKKADREMCIRDRLHTDSYRSALHEPSSKGKSHG